MTGTHLTPSEPERNPFFGQAGDGPLTMSSREIAELCEKRHDHVMRDAKKMLAELEEAAPNFGGSYLGADGTSRPCLNLPKDLTLTLVAGYNVKLRKRIIDRWMELEEERANGGFAVPKTFGEALQLAADQYRQIEAMRDDVAAHDRLVRADGSLSITEVAKNLGVRPKDLFTWLSTNGWIYKRPGGASWLGYHSKTSVGYLEHKTTTVLRADGSEKITEQVRVTAKGLSQLAKLVPSVARPA